MNYYEKKLEQYLKENNLKAEQVFFKETCHTVKDAAKVAKAKPEDFVKSICLLDSKNNLIVAVVLGTDRVSLEKISKNLNIEPPRIARPKEILEISGYPCGGVPPFGFAAKFLIDLDVMKKEVVYAGGGSDKSLIQVSPKEIHKANEGLIMNVRRQIP